MKFYREVRASYSQAHNQAKRSVRRAEKESSETCLQQLKFDMDQTQSNDSVELGIIDIPVSQIVGTAVFDEKDLYAPDFMPIASASSPYAAQWCQLYMDYLTDRGWDSPIRCIEYLGRFYVQDGKKRVSVLKAHGAYTTEAIVTRIVPAASEDEKIQRYHEFLRDYQKTGLYQTAFTNPGGLSKLQTALGYEEDHVWSDQDRFSFLFNLLPVEYALGRAFGGYLNITAADALLVLLEDYSYGDIRRMQPWELTNALQNEWVKLYKIFDPDFDAVSVGAAKKIA